MRKFTSDIMKKLQRATPLRHLYHVLTKEEKIQFALKSELTDKIIKLREFDEYRYGLMRVYNEIREQLAKIAFSHELPLEKRQAAHDKLEVFEMIENALNQKIEEGLTARIKLKKDEEQNGR